MRLIGVAELVGLIFTHYDRFEPRIKALLPLKRSYIPAAINGRWVSLIVTAPVAWIMFSIADKYGQTAKQVEAQNRDMRKAWPAA